MRLALIATAALNIFGAALFVPSFGGLRGFYGLPSEAPPLYLWIISSWIFLFGLCYLWLGVSGRTERLFLVIGAAGKLAFVLLIWASWLGGEVPLRTALGSLSDLFFAVVFALWLRGTRNGALPA
jgi:hypothetical protein